MEGAVFLVDLPTQTVCGVIDEANCKFDFAHTLLPFPVVNKTIKNNVIYVFNIFALLFSIQLEGFRETSCTPTET